MYIDNKNKKKYLFFIVFFLMKNSLLSVALFDNKDIILHVTKKIELNFLPKFYQNFMSDIAGMYELIKQLIVEKKNVPELSLLEKIADYKNGEFLFIQLKNQEFISKTKQISILTFILYNAFIVFSNEKKKEDLMRQDTMQNVSMLMAMTGFSFHCSKNIRDIIEVIVTECEFLKNDTLDDMTYQSTVYAIIENISHLIVNQNILMKILENIYIMEKDSLKKEIKFSNKNITKKNLKK